MSQSLKKCRTCGKKKELSEFKEDDRYKGGYRHHCYQCMADQANKKYHENKSVWYSAQVSGYPLKFYKEGGLSRDSKLMLQQDGLQYCSRCGKIYTETEFASAKALICMYCVAAKECQTFLAFRGMYYKYINKMKTDKQKQFILNREVKKHKYKFSGKQVAKMAKKQNGKCNICAAPLQHRVRVAVLQEVFTGKEARILGTIICKECLEDAED